MDGFPCHWRGVTDGKPMVGGLESFGAHVLETLWGYLQEEVRFDFRYSCFFSFL